MKKYILAIDEGTTSARAIIFDTEGNIVSLAREKITQIFPKNGWVEQDPNEIYEKQYQCILKAIRQANISPNDIISAGITNQRETTIIWNKKTGKPIYNAIVWQDRRTADVCTKIKRENPNFFEKIKQKTGLIIDPYFSATKIQWILKNTTENIQDLMFGTIDTWLIWKFTGNHYTDPSNASRTMLLNIHSINWDEELLQFFNIPKTILPEIKDSNSLFGYINIEGANIPIKAVLGDQQAALFGQNAISVGETKVTYGTGCFLLMNTGNQAIYSNNGMLTTIAWKLQDEEPIYALEGASFTAGAGINWLEKIKMLIPENININEELKNKLELYTISEISNILEKYESKSDVFFVPAFTGLGAPYWDPYARGTITGLSLATNKIDIIKAAIESMAFQVDELLQAFARDYGEFPTKLKVDGGASANNYLMQFQANISGIEVIRPKVIETTAWGVASLSAGITQYTKDKTWQPIWSKDKRDSLRKKWKKAVQRALKWEDN